MNCKLTQKNRVAFTKHVYEIHGNVLYMHCSDDKLDCSKKFVTAPSIADFEAAMASAESATVTDAKGRT